LSLSRGEIDVWAAFDGPKLVGFISSRIGPHFLQYQQQNENKHGPTAEIVEYVVHPDYRNKGIGTTLVKKVKAGIFEQHNSVGELYVIHHADNIPSNRTFVKNGFTEVDTFYDRMRQRYTSVMKYKMRR
jgi:RimJ/RimL family protein N-acetyltransferase